VAPPDDGAYLDGVDAGVADAVSTDDPVLQALSAEIPALRRQLEVLTAHITGTSPGGAPPGPNTRGGPGPG
jgi:hypothetical protein